MPIKAIELFHQISNPDDVIIILLFNACAQLGTNQSLNLVKKISLECPKSFQLNPRYLSSLLDAFIKCKDLVNAEKIFSKVNKSLINYGNLINGYKKDNNQRKILGLFEQMINDQIQPDLVICLTVIKALGDIGDCDISKSLIKLIPDHILIDKIIQNALIHMWVCLNK